jgi:hypothetical protein
MQIRAAAVVCLTAALSSSNGNGFAAVDGTANACGCHQDSAGYCYCDHKSKCGCPGECEPKGCEEKRTKLLNKEIELETKKAEAQNYRQKPASTDDGTPRDARPISRSPSKGQSLLGPRMTSTQKQQLARLLDLYVAARPETRQETIDQVRAQLPGTDKNRTR